MSYPDGARLLYDELLPRLRSAARVAGYALAVHGSGARDLDLVAARWVEHALHPESLLERLRLACFLRSIPFTDAWLETRALVALHPTYSEVHPSDEVWGGYARVDYAKFQRRPFGRLSAVIHVYDDAWDLAGYLDLNVVGWP